MRRLTLLGVLSALCVESLPATTLIVDGVGASPNRFPSIYRALQELGRTGLGVDGAADEIAVITDHVTEEIGLVLNGGPRSVTAFYGPASGEVSHPVRDSIVIFGDADGNGRRCNVNFSSHTGIALAPGRATFLLASGQSVVLKDLALLLTHVGVGGVVTELVVVDEGDHDNPLVNATFTLDNVISSASLPGNLPQDSNDLTLRGTVVSDGFDGAEVFDMRSNPPGSFVNYIFRNCEVSHHQSGVFTLRPDSASIEVSNCRFTNNGFYYSQGNGGSLGYCVALVPLRDTSVVLRGVTAVGNSSGVSLRAPVASGARLTVIVADGSRFIRHFARGISLLSVNASGESLVTLRGTAERPIELSENGVGLRLGLDGKTQIQCSHLVVLNNAWEGIQVFGGPDGLHDSVSFDQCLIAGNGTSISRDPRVPVVGSVSFSAGNYDQSSIEFTDCTVHGSDSIGLSTLVAAGYPNVSHYLRATFRNCIFTGFNSNSLIHFNDAGQHTVIFQNSAVVREGPYALGEVNSSELGTALFNRVIYSDPQFLNTDTPVNASSFDVYSPAYATAGDLGQPLSGWGDFLADMWGHAGMMWR